MRPKVHAVSTSSSTRSTLPFVLIHPKVIALSVILITSLLITSHYSILNPAHLRAVSFKRLCQNWAVSLVIIFLQIEIAFLVSDD
jgi:hypothetical protein